MRPEEIVGLVYILLRLAIIGGIIAYVVITVREGRKSK